MTEAVATTAAPAPTPAPAPAPAPSPAPAPAAPWYNEADDETKGWLQNRGWDKLPPDKAALEAVKARREAERKLGVPPEQLVRLPKDASDEAAWNALHEKLGVPKNANDYRFDNIKHASGGDPAPELVAEVKEIAHALKLDPARAAALMDTIVKRADAEVAKQDSNYAAHLEAEKAKLKADWGANYALNLTQARRAAAALGVQAEELTYLEQTVGYARVMSMFQNIGARLGSDRMVTGTNSMPTSVASAKARLADLTNDPVWRNKFFNNEADAKSEFELLTQLIATS